MPAVITHLQRANMRPPWQPREVVPGLVTFDDRPASDIVGSYMDGSLHEITLLHDGAWRFLRYLQNLCRRSVRICPLSDAFIGRDPLEPQADDPASRHINGDILVALTECGEDALRELLDTDYNPTITLRRMPRTYPSPEERRTRLTHLLQGLFGPAYEAETDLVYEILGYLRKILQSSL